LCIKENAYSVVEVVAVPVPSVKELHLLALVLSPLVTVAERRIQAENDDAGCEEDYQAGSANDGVLLDAETSHTSGGEVPDLTKGDDREEKSREVVVQEKLTLHEEEGEVVESPAQDRHTDLVVETLEDGVAVVIAAALPPQDRESLEDSVEGDSGGRRPPDKRVTDKVDLAVVAAPEVDTTAENWPRLGTRVPRVRVDEASVGGPHDALEFPEFAEEARVAVVDLLSVFLELRVLVALDVPDAVGESATLGASDFLLFETPVRQLDLVGKQHTASHQVDELELGLDSAKTLLGLLAIRHGLHNFDAEEIVGIALEALVSVSAHLVLPVGLSDRRAVIVRVNTTVSNDMVQAEDRSVNNPFRIELVPGHGSRNGSVAGRVTGPVNRLSLVLQEEHVVLVLVGVEGDLLLLATSRVHVLMRVQVATLSVVVAETDTCAKCNISGDVSHGLCVEGRLELAAHEAVTVTRVDEADKVNCEHGHVEGDGNDNQTESASKEVLEPNSGGNILGVSEQDPQLEHGKRADPCDCEETNPLDAERGTESDSRCGQPEPPGGLESVLRTELMLVLEGDPRQSSHPSEEHQRGVQQDEAGLSDKTVLEDDQSRAECRSGRLAARSLQCKVHDRHSQYTANGRQKPHGHIGHTRLDVVLSNILEIEVSIEAGQPTSESDQELGERRVNVHEELALDVLARKATEVDLIEDDRGGLVDAEETNEQREDGKGAQEFPITALEVGDVVVLDAIGGVVGFAVYCFVRTRFCGFGRCGRYAGLVVGGDHVGGVVDDTIDRHWFGAFGSHVGGCVGR
jgi:hypothetical protein